jgi:hypothetical protein
MAFSLDRVVPWGRSFDEYVAMFRLSGRDLDMRLLGCGDGPANFNSLLTKRGGRVVSVDPLYGFGAEQIRRRIEATSGEVLEQTRHNAHEFVWDRIASVEELGRMRAEAMEEFLADYERGRQERRYVEGALPGLPFAAAEFDIALCSHLLFLYSEHLSEEFHLRSIRELCRVAREARIFPLLELGARKSRHLEPVMARLKGEGLSVSIEEVDYEFQRGGNRMLRATVRHEAPSAANSRPRCAL